MTNPISSLITIKKDIDKSKITRLTCTLLSDKQMNLTVAEAERIVDMKTFKLERPISEAHVQELYDEMANGRFLAEHVRIATAKLGNEVYRINGQHTCLARAFMPANYQCFVRLLEYEVPNEDELRKLYSTFDPAYSARSSTHLIKVLLGDTEATAGINVSVISHIASSYRFWQFPDIEQRKRQGHNELATLIEANSHAFKTVGEFNQAHRDNEMFVKRHSVIAAMFECHDRRPSIWQDFWKPVCDGLGLTEKTDPRYALRRWLQEHGLAVRGNGAKDRAKQSTPEETYRICISACNKWRDGEGVQTLRSSGKRVRAK